MRRPGDFSGTPEPPQPVESERSARLRRPARRQPMAAPQPAPRNAPVTSVLQDTEPLNLDSPSLTEATAIRKPGRATTVGATQPPLMERTVLPAVTSRAATGAPTVREGGPSARSVTGRDTAPTSVRPGRGAVRARRKQERAEIRRFTADLRRRRRRRWIALGVVVTLVGLLLVGIFSPLFAVRQIEVLGTNRVDAEAVSAALADQLDTPLPLVDPGSVAQALEQFPAIESFVVESALPSTLVVRIVERTPVALLREGNLYVLVDAAGVELGREVDRPKGLPVAAVDNQGVEGQSFKAAIRVIRALPAELRSKVDSVRARTLDDVVLAMRDSDLIVHWGSADDSVQKARVLAALMAKNKGGTPKEFDVSSPSSPIQR